MAQNKSAAALSGALIRTPIALAIAGLLAVTAPALRAAEFDTGSPDLKFRWDNTFKYSTAFRLKNPDGALFGGPNYDVSDHACFPNTDDGDRNFKRGIISSRLDWLTEADASWRNQVPWTRSINEKTADGYVGLIDENGIRVVADGFTGTDEIRFDANEEWLYVVETNARRISRLRVAGDGSLSQREVYGPSDLGGFPDDFAFDSFGNLWITLILTERLIALTPEGEVLTLLDDGNPQALARYEEHYAACTTTPELMGACRGTLAPMMASLTFGGPDLKTVYLGSLGGTTLPCFRSPVAGLPLAHWHR